MQSLSLAPYIAINTMDILRTTIINKPAIVCFVTSKDFFFFKKKNCSSALELVVHTAWSQLRAQNTEKGTAG